MEDSNSSLKEDLEFARRTEEAWKEIEAGKGIKMGVNEFLKKLEKWKKMQKRKGK